MGSIHKAPRRPVFNEVSQPGPIPVAITAMPAFPVAALVLAGLDKPAIAEFHTPAQDELGPLLVDRLTSMQRSSTNPPSGLSPGKTAQICALSGYFRAVEPHETTDKDGAKKKWTDARNVRAPANDPVKLDGLCPSLNHFCEA